MPRNLFAMNCLALVLFFSVAGADTPTTKPATAPADARWQDLPHTNTVFKPVEYRTLDEWQARRKWLREQVRFAAGLWPEPARTPLNAKIFGKHEYDGYTIEKVYFESYPGFYVTGNLYRPAKIEGKIPAVACPHGHWPHGRIHQDELGDIPARCITLARLGATVFAYDMLGYNDSKRQIDHRINTPERDLWGITSLHLQTWNSMRVLDFLQSLPEVDPERLGVTGASGGGTQTFMLYAVDDRVKVAAPVNMISSTMQGGCICENAPCLRIDTNNMEIGALMAPKPLLMISATGDWTKLTPQVEYPFVRSIYELYGAADKVKNVHIDAPHNYNKASREAMYHFFAKWLLKRDDADGVTEGEIPKFKAEELLVWTDETAPKDLLTVEQLIRQLQDATGERVMSLRPDNPGRYEQLLHLVQSGLMYAAASRFPLSSAEAGDVQAKEQPRRGELDASDIICTRQGRTVRTMDLLSLKQVLRVNREAVFRDTRFIVWVSPEGLAARNTQAGMVEGLARAAHKIVFVEACGTNGRTLSSQPAFGQFFSTFNRTLHAESVFDVITALGVELHPRSPSEQDDIELHIRLNGQGRMGPSCLLARALVPPELVRRQDLRTVIDMDRFSMDSNEAYLKDLSIPHIRRIGGLRAIAAVACNGPIWFHNVGDKFDEDWVQAAGKVNGVEVRVTREKADEKAIAEWLTK